MKEESEDISKKVVVIMLVIAVILSIYATVITLTQESSAPATAEKPVSVSKVGSVSFVINPPIRDKASVGFTISK